MVRSFVRAARAPLILIFLTLPALAHAIEPGVVEVRQVGGQSSGVIVGPELVLTSNHGTNRGGVTVSGMTATVIASDSAKDLALLRVPGLSGTPRQVAGPSDPSTGKATLYGFPGGTYRETACSVNSRGDLDCTVYAGTSGGPLLNPQAKVIGVLVRYHQVTTAETIREFLRASGYEQLYRTDLVRNPPPRDSDLDRKLNEFDRALDNLERVLERSRPESERMMREQLEEFDRLNREFLKRFPKP